MGNGLVGKAWSVTDLYHTEKYVLIALSYYADEKTKLAFLSYEELSRLTGISNRQVKRVVKSLTDHNPPYITPDSNVFNKSLWRVNL